MTAEDALDLVHKATRMSFSSSASVCSISVLIRNARLSGLSTGQASLGVRVVVSSTLGSSVVGEVTSGSVSRDASVLTVNTGSSDARRGSVNVETVGSCCAGQVAACDTLVARSTLVSIEGCRSVFTVGGVTQTRRVAQARRVFRVGCVVGGSGVGAVLARRGMNASSAGKLRGQTGPGVVLTSGVVSCLSGEVVASAVVGGARLLE